MADLCPVLEVSVSKDQAIRSAEICRQAYAQAVDLEAQESFLVMLRQTIVWYEMRAMGATMRGEASA